MIPGDSYNFKSSMAISSSLKPGSWTSGFVAKYFGLYKFRMCR
jgi:hypothetical protein